MNRLEKVILRELMKNEKYCRKVLPFIQDNYFHDESERLIYTNIRDFILQYNNLPTFSAMNIAVERTEKINATIIKDSVTTIGEMELATETFDESWLLNETEKFCQDKAIYNSVSEAISILDPKYKGPKTKGAIPDILREALSVSFDHNVGHDYLADASLRFEFYHRTEEKIPFDIAILNKITNGGLPRKTLSIFLAGTNVGKSLAMCHMASGNLRDNKNVLYITAEMAEEKIAQRIDANLLDITLDDLLALPKELYDKKIERVRSKTTGRLIIKEYPTGVATVTHFRTLLNELLLKCEFKPDIIYIDYINICASSRIKMSGGVNSYTYIKSIAEEFRGLGQEFNVPIVSATQVNRAGFNDTDLDLTNTAESFGLPATADFMLALITNDDLIKKGQIMGKQLKQRDGDKTKDTKFLMGIDYPKMRLFDVNTAVTNSLVNEGPAVSDTRDKTKWAGLVVEEENEVLL